MGAKTLQEELFGQTDAGVVFFEKLERFYGQRDSANLADILEVYLLCLLLGFEGRYSGALRAELDNIVEKVKRRIDDIRGDNSRLSPSCELPDEPALASAPSAGIESLPHCRAGRCVIHPDSLPALALEPLAAAVQRYGQGWCSCVFRGAAVSIKALLFGLFLYVCLVWVAVAYWHSGLGHRPVLDRDRPDRAPGLSDSCRGSPGGGGCGRPARPLVRRPRRPAAAPVVTRTTPRSPRCWKKPTRRWPKHPAIAPERGKMPLCELPVYLLIGPEGSGKTSTFINSSVEPQLLAGQVTASGPVVPTRLCNIWLAGKAIFVELSGRTFSGDLGRWRELLGVLRGKANVPLWRRLWGTAVQQLELARRDRILRGQGIHRGVGRPATAGAAGARLAGTAARDRGGFRRRIPGLPGHHQMRWHSVFPGVLPPSAGNGGGPGSRLHATLEPGRRVASRRSVRRGRGQAPHRIFPVRCIIGLRRAASFTWRTSPTRRSAPRSTSFPAN